MVAEPEALDRQRAQAEVAALLEELRAAVDVHALAVGEVEPQCIEAAARHGHAEAGAVAGILQREEDALPAFVPAQLGHFALDPDRRQAAEPVRDAVVERRDGVDLPFSVVERLDLHGLSVLRRRARGGVRACFDTKAS